MSDLIPPAAALLVMGTLIVGCVIGIRRERRRGR
jgi:hypothetical protein